MGTIVFAYIFGILILLIVGKVLLLPIKFILKLVYNAVIGGVVLVLINLFGNMINFHIPLNFVSCIMVGVLGIPGVILTCIFKYIF